MAEVVLNVGGYRYRVACADGGEAHLIEVAALLDIRVAEAARTMGELGETRQLLFAGLLLADAQLEQARAPAAIEAVKAPVLTALENLATRLEALADGLETGHVIT